MHLRAPTAESPISDEAPLPGATDEPITAGSSVFMSPLNVHVNRAPVGGESDAVDHTAGEFRAAFRDDASEHNERNLIRMPDADGPPLRA